MAPGNAPPVCQAVPLAGCLPVECAGTEREGRELGCVWDSGAFSPGNLRARCLTAQVASCRGGGVGSWHVARSLDCQTVNLTDGSCLVCVFRE